MLSFKEGQPNNESPCIGKEDLRQVQGHHPPRGGQGDLRERKAQAAPGLVESLVNGGSSTEVLSHQFTVLSKHDGTKKSLLRTEN
jgi:hypothetical protein